MGLLTTINTPAVIAAAQYVAAPPPGQQHSVPIPGTQQADRTAAYRHWRFQDELLRTLDPNVRTAHEYFETAVRTVPTNRCFGRRPYDAATKTYGDYVWQDYQTIARRRENFGKGLVELHAGAGVTGTQRGVGLWCQNRPEWQITG